MKKRVFERSERFNENHPPPTIERARTEIEILERIVEDIEVRLVETPASRFPDSESFTNWVIRTNDALRHMHHEQKFLRSWLRERGVEVPEEEETNEHDDSHRPAIRAGRQRAEAIASDIREQCGSEFGLPPANRDAAHNQLGHLHKAAQALGFAYREVGQYIRGLKPGRRDVQYVFAPLNQLQASVLKETLFVKEFLTKERAAEYAVRDGDFRDRLNGRLEKIRSTFTVHYDIDHLPTGSEAREQYVKLSAATATAHQLQKEIDATQRSGNTRVSNACARELRGNIARLISEVEPELIIVKRVMQQDVQADVPAWWKVLLIGALTRAKSEGFKLTNEEEAMYRKLSRHAEKSS